MCSAFGPSAGHLRSVQERCLQSRVVFSGSLLSGGSGAGGRGRERLRGARECLLCFTSFLTRPFWLYPLTLAGLGGRDG